MFTVGSARDRLSRGRVTRFCGYSICCSRDGGLTWNTVRTLPIEADLVTMELDGQSEGIMIVRRSLEDRDEIHLLSEVYEVQLSNCTLNSLRTINGNIQSAVRLDEDQWLFGGDRGVLFRYHRRSNDLLIEKSWPNLEANISALDADDDNLIAVIEHPSAMRVQLATYQAGAWNTVDTDLHNFIYGVSLRNKKAVIVSGTQLFQCSVI
jgi:hypothetical protein